MRKRILVVDDDRDVLESLRMVLEHMGHHEVRLVNMSSQAVFVARHYKPDLVLLDCMMPGMDGGEVAGQLQADPELSHVPFAFLTCTVDRAQCAPSKCYVGEHWYIPKTMKCEQFLEAVEACCAGQSLATSG